MAVRRRQGILFTSQSGLEVGNALRRLNRQVQDSAEIVGAEGPGIGDQIRTSTLSEFLIDNIRKQYDANLKVIRKSPNDLFLIHFHSCFWKKGASFTVANRFIERVQKLVQIRAVVTLIDDFYSVYFRIRKHYDDENITEKVNPLDLLYWRASDVMLAGMLANQLNVQHFVISVNHPLRILERLLFHPHVTVYAGHPITDVRLLERKQRALAERLIKRINNEFLLPLCGEPFVTFMPDTIDEAPILGPPRTYGELCAKTWPREWLTQQDIPIVTQPESSVCNQYFDDLRKYFAGSKETYQDAIMGQISDRDYRLVNQTNNFIFVLLKQVPSSGGVEAELTQARYGYKDIYFFNPDRVKRGKSGHGVPNWANNLTGESHDLGGLMKKMGPTDPALISAKRRS